MINREHEGLQHHRQQAARQPVVHRDHREIPIKQKDSEGEAEDEETMPGNPGFERELVLQVERVLRFVTKTEGPGLVCNKVKCFVRIEVP